MAAALPLFVCWLLGQLRPGGPSALTADEIQNDAAHHQSVARGHVLLKSGTLLLHTDELRYDQDTQRFTINGPLFGVDRTTLLTAHSATGTLGDDGVGGKLSLQGVRIEEYQWLPPDIGLRAKTAAEVRAAGKLLMAIDGERLRQLAPGHYELDGVSISPCLCPSPEKCRPNWALATAHADVHAGDYALLTFPQLRLGDVPLPLLRPPWLYVPLSHRRSGFLLPHLNWQSQNGFLLDEPGYLTLGESADLTLSAGYITGQPETGAGAGGVQGPRASGELRYAPREGSTGRLVVSVLDDQHHDLSPAGAAVTRGARGSLRALEIDDFGARDGDRFDLSLVSDARLTSQLTTDLLFAALPATRSTAQAFHRSDDWLFTVDGVFLQDFQGAFSPDNVHQLLFGPGAPSTLARLPALTAQLADTRLGHTPLHWSLTTSAVREGVLGAAYDSLSLGAVPGSLPTTVPQARAATDQLDLTPTLSLPVQFGRFAAATLSAKWREDVWLFESSPVPAGLPGPALPNTGARGYPVFNLDLETTLSRDFGSSGGAAAGTSSAAGTEDTRLRHTLSPALSLRAIPFQALSGTVPPLWYTPGSQIADHATGLPVATSLALPYDEIALATGPTAPVSTAAGTFARSQAPGGIAQGALHVDQRLRGHRGELLRLDVGETFDGSGPVATYALAQARAAHLHASGFADYSSQALPCPGTVSITAPGQGPGCTSSERALRRLSEAYAEAGANDNRGDGVSLTFERAVAAGAPRLGAPIDLLFATRLPTLDPSWALPDISQLGAQVSARIGAGLTAHGSVSYQLPASAISQIIAGLGYNSPQHCCNLDVNAVFQPSGLGQAGLGFAALFLVFDLGEFAGSASH